LSTTAIYARLNLDPVRKALDAHATQVQELLETQPEHNGKKAVYASVPG
jgi:hypothetical protein